MRYWITSTLQYPSTRSRAEGGADDLLKKHCRVINRLEAKNGKGQMGNASTNCICRAPIHGHSTAPIAVYLCELRAHSQVHTAKGLVSAPL